jgi:hypothetical protein
MSKQCRVFFDTELQGLPLELPNPRLLAIGCVTQAGEEFYAEVTLTDELRAGCHPWVRKNVIPHLQGGEKAMDEAEISRRLHAWLYSLMPGRRLTLITDTPMVDGPYVHALLAKSGYPENMDRRVWPMTMSSPKGWQRYHSVMEAAQKDRRHRAHHALDDAKVNRMAWIAGNRNDTLSVPGIGL